MNDSDRQKLADAMAADIMRDIDDQIIRSFMAINNIRRAKPSRSFSPNLQPQIFRVTRISLISLDDERFITELSDVPGGNAYYCIDVELSRMIEYTFGTDGITWFPIVSASNSQDGCDDCSVELAANDIHTIRAAIDKLVKSGAYVDS